MKQTLIAIALSATFCWSSYALAEEEGLSVESAIGLFDGSAAGIVEWCIENAEAKEITIGECISAVYRGAAQVLVEEAYRQGHEAADCATKSREIYNF